MVNNLTEIRKSKGRTLDQLSKESGVPVTSIWEYEKGIKFPGINKAYKIANALKVSVFRIWPNDKGE